MTTETEDFLEHYGKKGMRWGVRHRSKAEDKARGKQFNQNGKVRQSTDYKRTTAYRNRPVQTLSNHQLQVVKKRMELEQNFRKVNPTKVDKGQNFVKGVIATGAVATSLYSLAKSPMAKALVSNGKRLMEQAMIRGATL